MRLEDERESNNVEDRRGAGGGFVERVVGYLVKQDVVSAGFGRHAKGGNRSQDKRERQ